MFDKSFPHYNQIIKMVSVFSSNAQQESSVYFPKYLTIVLILFAYVNVD